MALSRVGLSQEQVVETLRSQLANMAAHEPERSMSNTRLTASILSLFFGIAAIYGSFFYLPAYYDVGTALGFSNEEVKLPAVETDEKKRHALSPYTDKFKLRRGYIRQGQALNIAYVLSPGTQLHVSIKRCNAPIFVEVFTCMDVEGQDVVIPGGIKGSRDFVMRKAGFYYFDELVTNRDGTPTDEPHVVVWTRVYETPAP